MSNWTIQSVLDWAASDFEAKGMERPRFEAEVLLAHVLGFTRLELYTKFDSPLEESERARFREAISKRRSGYPVAYITGYREFWSLDFEVNEHVLVPRPETELLVETALKSAPGSGRILDLCTGSGCIAISLATELGESTIHAVDLSKEACDTAVGNAKKHGVEERVSIWNGDLFDPLPADSKYHVIVTNPPYIPTGEMDVLPPEVQKEPRIALDGGEDGLDLVRQILKGATKRLEPGGCLMMEVDPRQTHILSTELGPAFLGVEGEVLADLAGLDRVVRWIVL